MAENVHVLFQFLVFTFFFLKVNVVTDMPMKGRVNSKGTMQLGSSLALADSLHAFIYFNLLPQSLSIEVSYHLCAEDSPVGRTLSSFISPLSLLSPVSPWPCSV